MLESFIYNKLTDFTKRYLAAHPDIVLVAVVGSTDKAMTRQSIGTIVAQGKRIRLHEHQAKIRLATPMSILGIAMPENPKSIFAWLRVFRAANDRVKEPANVDVIVQELTLRKPGDMNEFAHYIHANIAVVTSIAAEHLDTFETTDALANEYLTIGDMADLVVVNRDAVDSSFAKYERNPNITTYGSDSRAEYWIAADDSYLGAGGTPVEIHGPEFTDGINASIQLIGQNAFLAALAGGVVGVKIGLGANVITEGVNSIRTLPGRMNPLVGLDQTLVIDDTYRAHPSNAIAGLQSLYQFNAAPQRIAILSSMPDLGASSQAEHERVAGFCSPDMLAWVVVVGEDAIKYLAPAARKRGCQVHESRDAIQAAEFVRSVTEQGAVILVEGASPETYLEEATKILCSVSEENKLVRSTPEWAAIKQSFFDKIY